MYFNFNIECIIFLSGIGKCFFYLDNVCYFCSVLLVIYWSLSCYGLLHKSFLAQWIIDPIIHNNIVYSAIQLAAVNTKNTHSKICCEILLKQKTNSKQ